jgi:hypothetical protein
MLLKQLNRRAATCQTVPFRDTSVGSIAGQSLMPILPECAYRGYGLCLKLFYLPSIAAENAAVR